MTDVTISRAVLEQALDALSNTGHGLLVHNGRWVSANSLAMDALRAALAAQAAGPA